MVHETGAVHGRSAADAVRSWHRPRPFAGAMHAVFDARLVDCAAEVAAHHRELPNAAHDRRIGFESGGDVGERADGHELEVGWGAKCAAEHLDGVVVRNGGRAFVIEDAHALVAEPDEPSAAVEWLGAAGID